ncbi:GntR family transcriptional regulator [Brucella gallinifaecis]|uniref:GntR family transcriptional regulator n=1 Tax=Brucella gallinifaecis TaxID=215590 RepID=A0A502BN66_9HYPH|nr:GntR family transcriptional regulator [Brucella gallinifaecis]TPF74708.1 GntR family transcriptional regulator [Brucella gallinifaecis]
MTDYMLETIERNETLSDRVKVSLRKALIEGTFEPGSRIKIRDIAHALGVSPTPAREALMTLIAEGALIEDSNKTAIVPALTRESLLEITELRVSLERTAARIVVPLLDDASLKEIEHFNMRIVKASETDDMKRGLEENANFHFAIYRLTQMPMLLKMIETVWLRSGAYLNLAYPAFANLNTSHSKHRVIIDALRSRDVDALEQAIEDDIRTSAHHLFKSLDKHLSDNV